MALTERQKNILTRGMRLRKLRDNQDSKSFIEILDEALTPAVKSTLITNLKSELVARAQIIKTRSEQDISDLEK
jgi:hypothetical protein